MDGYNPYRITRDGIDWEVDGPGRSVDHIGYWGDHQIIYLLKFLERPRQFHPARLARAAAPARSSATRTCPIGSGPSRRSSRTRREPWTSTTRSRLESRDRVAATGADGKLVSSRGGDVYQVNLLEKLLVPLLAKLGNLVPDGGHLAEHPATGVERREQRPGRPRRLDGHAVLHASVRSLPAAIAGRRNREPSNCRQKSASGWPTPPPRSPIFARSWGTARSTRTGDGNRCGNWAWRRAATGCRCTAIIRFSGKVERPLGQVTDLLADTLAAIDHSIRSNRREDGTYNAYNLLDVKEGEVGVDSLYLMLEGQVAALSSGAVAPQAAAALVETLFGSDIYRADQRSFMLYPDRPLPGLLEKNRIPADRVEALALLRRMIAANDDRIIARDAGGCYRFNADFTNVGDLDARLDHLSRVYGEDIEASREQLHALYESVFRHRDVYRSFRHHVRLRGPRMHLLAHGVEAAPRAAGEFLRGARRQCGG